MLIKGSLWIFAHDTRAMLWCSVRGYVAIWLSWFNIQWIFNWIEISLDKLFVKLSSNMIFWELIFLAKLGQLLMDLFAQVITILCKMCPNRTVLGVTYLTYRGGSHYAGILALNDDNMTCKPFSHYWRGGSSQLDFLPRGLVIRNHDIFYSVGINKLLNK